MSHKTTLRGVKITDLPALRRAAERLGFELRMNQKEFSHYHHRCTHALHMRGREEGMSIGLDQQADGSYTLVTDFYGSMRCMLEQIGTNGDTLMREYTHEKVLEEAQAQCWSVTSDEVLEDGSVRLLLTI